MILVHDINDYLMKEDMMALSHLDYALQERGGELRDLKSGVGGLKNNERLHIVGHGGSGTVVNMNIDELVATLRNGIPRDHSCRILVTTCYAGASSGGFEDGVSNPGNAYSSVIKQIARGMKGWSQATLYGYTGPTITNVNMSPRIAFVPAANVPDAGKIQSSLLHGKYKTLYWQTWGPSARETAWETAGKQPAKLAHNAAVDSRQFYQEFHDTLQNQNLLTTEREALATVDILS